MKKEAKNDKLAWVNRIDFASEEAGKSAVIIGTTQPVDYQINQERSLKINIQYFDDYTNYFPAVFDRQNV